MFLSWGSLLVWLLGSYSVAPEARLAAKAFEEHYRSASTLEAQFLEEYLEQGRITRTEAGTVYFQKPGRMRWEYAVPEKSLFLVDGKFAWFYVPADHTVLRVPAKKSSDWRTPLALLAGEMKLSRVCESVRLAKRETVSDPERAVLICQIRGATTDTVTSNPGLSAASEPGALPVLFEVRRSSGELVRVQVREPGGILIDFHFKNWRVDPPLAAPLFRFQAPAGVAIVNGELPGGERPERP